MIDRPHYIDWLNRWKHKDVIKVISGMRRCGKSTVMFLFQQQLKASGVDDKNILSLNFESLDQDYPRTSKALYDYIRDQQAAKGITYVFLDEIQQVEDFERVVDALFIRENIDLYITGSNAYYLSGELATLLTGRYVELNMLPFSFKEYTEAFEIAQKQNEADNPQINRESLFNRYLTYGGLPLIAELTSETAINEYLNGVFNTIIVKDIVKRRPRMDLRLFEASSSFLADNIGSFSSTNSIANNLTQQGTKISRGTVDEHIEALIENFLLFKTKKYNLKGKQYLKAQEKKYYLGDLGFRFWQLGRKTGDVGHRIENLVYLELRRRFDRVDVGVQAGKEIDFVASDARGLHYFQVAQTVLDEKTLERELMPLQAIEDNYPKTLLTLDTVGSGSHAGVAQENLLDWLLGVT